MLKISDQHRFAFVFTFFILRTFTVVLEENEIFTKSHVALFLQTKYKKCNKLKTETRY